MKETDNSWEIELIQVRFKNTYNIVLTHDQAQAVFLYERVKDSGSATYTFSIWEEAEFELISLQKILTNDQLKLYSIGYAAWQTEQEAWLIENDKAYLPELEKNKKLLDHYRENFLPAVREPALIISVAFRGEQEKIDYLKAAYRKYLVNDRK